jgi:hypothetical protein
MHRFMPPITVALALIGLAVPTAANAATSAGQPARAVYTAGERTGPPSPLASQPALAPPKALRLPPEVHRVCPLPTRVGQMECMLLSRTNTRHYFGVRTSQAPSGYAPSDLQNAYNLTTASSANGTGETVAVVDAYSDPNAASDLATYRAQFGLPACDPTTGGPGCLTVVNEDGQSSPLPTANSQWALEESVDLDMVSAICPNCSLLLVEANSNALTDLGTADNTAVSMGAAFVTDSWDGVEFPTESYYDNVYFNHPGVAIAVASGDSGYGTGWPSASQYVTSVGGTSLTQDSGVPRGWDETVWDDSYGATGSGCSDADPKPAWQTMDDTSPTGCLNRTENDVSAVADPATGVAVYDSYDANGWSVEGGTSVAAPIIASVYALAGTPTPDTYPASYLYQSGAEANLYDVTTGSNGTCESDRQYLCNAETGYDGPTGWGTPDGTAAFANTITGDVVTLPDPGVQDVQTGTPFYLAVQALDSGTGQTLTYSATGLPSGLSISSTTGDITGTLDSTAGTSNVTVTATDGTGASGSVTFAIVAVASMLTGYHGVSGPVDLDLDGKCLDDTGDSTHNGNKIQIWTCNGEDSQNWEFIPDGGPGEAGTMNINGKCLDIEGRGTANETKIDLYSCNSGANQQWLIDGSADALYNPISGKCMADPGGSTHNGTQVWIYSCTGAANQAWILPPSPVQSGVAGWCMNDTNDSSGNGTPVAIDACNGQASQKWTLEPDGTLRINGKCLDVTGRSMLDGAGLQLWTCNTDSTTNANQHWYIGPTGQLFNQNSGRCLDDPGNSTVNGTQLVQEDCYGETGEIWAVT